MDILLTVALLVIALCMAFGKGFKITIIYSYDKVEEVKETTTQTELDESYKAVTDISKSIQEFMGVNLDE